MKVKIIAKDIRDLDYKVYSNTEIRPILTNYYYKHFSEKWLCLADIISNTISAYVKNWANVFYDTNNDILKYYFNCFSDENKNRAAYALWLKNNGAKIISGYFNFMKCYLLGCLTFAESHLNAAYYDKVKKVYEKAVKKLAKNEKNAFEFYGDYDIEIIVNKLKDDKKYSKYYADLKSEMEANN